MKKLLVFDLDGTIADTFTALVGVYNQLAPDFGCRPIKPDEIESARGKTPGQLMREYRVQFWKIPKLAVQARAQLKAQMHKIDIHDGLRLELEALKDQNYELGVLTSNSVENTEIFLKHHELDHLFGFVRSCGRMFGKHRCMNQLVRDMGYQRSDVMYIGDEIRDIRAAKKAGISILSVSWGFNTYQILKDEDPDLIIQHPSELVSKIHHHFQTYV